MVPGVAGCVRVGGRGEARVRALHPWVFRGDLREVPPLSNGALVRVRTESGRHLGWAFYSATSKIALRIASLADEPPDASFWNACVDAAVRHRQRVVSETDAFRVLFGESDGIPGLVVDRYGTHLVVQALTAGAEATLETALRALAERMEVDSVLARNDPAVRTLEGLPREVRQLRGNTPEQIEVFEGPIRYLVDPWRGQKTGAFLDQRENRLVAGAYSRGRVLDVFCYHGSFALHAASRADRVEAVDASAESLVRGRENAARAAVENVFFHEANAFDDLRERQREGQRFDTIFLDPPAFAKSRGDLPAALRGYKEINLRAIQLLAADGILVTSSCSYHLPEAAFMDLLAAAAVDARRAIRVIERRSQSRDHPLRLGFPESHYLKCLVLNVM